MRKQFQSLQSRWLCAQWWLWDGASWSLAVHGKPLQHPAGRGWRVRCQQSSLSIPIGTCIARAGQVITWMFQNQVGWWNLSLRLLQAPLGGERPAQRFLWTLAAASPTAWLKPAPPHLQLLDCSQVGRLGQLNIWVPSGLIHCSTDSVAKWKIRVTHGDEIKHILLSEDAVVAGDMAREL